MEEGKATVHEGLRECGRRRWSAVTQRLPRGVEREECVCVGGGEGSDGFIHPATLDPALIACSS